jgi:hypothetical protein
MKVLDAIVSGVLHGLVKLVTGASREARNKGRLG